MKTCITLFILLFQSAFGADCSTIELDKNGGAMSNVPVLDQGQTNTCYAHAGSVMLDAWVKSHGNVNYSTDPFLAALLTNQDLFSETLNNFSCDAVNSVIRNGSCSLKDLKQETNLSTFLTEIEKLYKPMTIKKQESVSFEAVQELEKKSRDMLCKIEKVIPGFVNENNVNDISKVLNAGNKALFIESFVKLICRGKLHKLENAPKCLSDRRISHGGEEKNRAYKEKLHQLLEAPMPQPIGIGYCAKVLLKGKDYCGFKPGFLGLTSLDVLKCGLHESVVIGRKKIGDKCFFKIRNSWGKRNRYHSDWENNNDGNVWVEEDALTRNMGSMAYLENE